MKYTTFDIEASNWVNFEILGTYNGTIYKKYNNLSKFIKEYTDFNKYKGYIHYAHYGGNYDFKFLLPYIVDIDCTIEIIDVGGRILEIKLRKNKKTIRFRDSYAILPKKQKDLCEMFKVKHMKQEIDFTKIKDWQNDKALNKRLEYDCKGLYQIINKYKEWLGAKNLSMTLASQSLKKWKSEFYTDKDLTFLNEKQEDFIRSGYYGGRVEIFKMYGTKLNYYDVNSLYPYVMKKEMPTGTSIKTRTYKNGKIGFYKIMVHDYSVDIPYLAFRQELKLIFPHGNFETYVTSVEIQELIKDKIKFEILDGLIFTDKKKIFKSYIDYFYKLKNKSTRDSSDYHISKLYMNSLYGKLGQRRDRVIVVKPDSFIETKDFIPYHEDYNLYLKEVHNDRGFILPYMSSYITSLARMELYRILKFCGKDHIYYCDTDSIITDRKLPTSNKIGDLKLEYDEIQEAVFLLPKTYALKLKNKTIIKIKGFQDNIFTFKDFKEALNNKDNTSLKSTYNKIVGYKENLRRFNNININRIEQSKRINHIYNKRIIKDKINTIPLTINNL